MKLVLWIGALIIAPFVIAKVDLWRRRGIGEAWGWWETENMPHELRTATLFLSERDIATSCRCRCTAGLTRCTRQSGGAHPA